MRNTTYVYCQLIKTYSHIHVWQCHIPQWGHHVPFSSLPLMLTSHYFELTSCSHVGIPMGVVGMWCSRVFMHMNKMLSLHPASMGICWTERPCRWCMSAMSLTPLVPKPTHAMSCPHHCQINVIKVPHQHLPHHAIQLHINAMSFTNKDVDVARGH